MIRSESIPTPIPTPIVPKKECGALPDTESMISRMGLRMFLACSPTRMRHLRSGRSGFRDGRVGDPKCGFLKLGSLLSNPYIHYTHGSNPN